MYKKLQQSVNNFGQYHQNKEKNLRHFSPLISNSGS
jgi:hypothetical protein